MEKVSFGEYQALYGDELDQADFDRLVWEACRAMDNAATGVDGMRKLEAAAPVGDGAEAVKRCQMELVHQLHGMERAGGTVVRADGTVTGRAVTSITAGAESISFAAPAGQNAGEDWRQGQVRAVIERYLAGVTDRNGVPLLYAGIYPVPLGEG